VGWQAVQLLDHINTGGASHSTNGSSYSGSEEINRKAGRGNKKSPNGIEWPPSNKKEHLELVSQEPMINKGTVYVKIF
jgi:hypothetical protein